MYVLFIMCVCMCPEYGIYSFVFYDYPVFSLFVSFVSFVIIDWFIDNITVCYVYVLGL